jgi:hypothetical protein
MNSTMIAILQTQPGQCISALHLRYRSDYAQVEFPLDGEAQILQFV